MKTRQEALDYGLSFPNTYQEAPFHDPNWQLIRVKDSKKVFLWTYERNGFINLNVKVSPAWRDFWRDAFPSVIPGWHQNKDNWNTIILDGSIPDDAIKNMIADSYDLVTYNPTRLIYEAVKGFQRVVLPHMHRLLSLQAIKKCAGLSAMPCTRIPILMKFHAIGW